MGEGPRNGRAEDAPDLESTAILLQRIRAGDIGARERLCARYLPMLKRWAHGRLPPGARELAETDDLVQVTLVRALEHVKEFEPRREGAFLAYLWRILLNAIRDEVRRHARRPRAEELDRDLSDSVLDQVIGRETMARYEVALTRLREEPREAVILRIEFGFTYDQIAEALGKPSAEAARKTVVRALAQLADTLHE